jgi:GT2 family glycosyltransferase
VPDTGRRHDWRPIKSCSWLIQRAYKARRLLNRRVAALAVRFVRRRGVLAFGRAFSAKLAPIAGYAWWARRHEPGATELELERSTLFDRQPVVSIAVPVYNTPAEYLTAMLDSVLAQTYERWELCIADGNSSRPEVRRILDEYGARDQRLRVVYLDENRGIAGNSNAALDLAKGDYVALLDHDDTLSPFALHEVVRAINTEPAADFLYSDEDKIDAAGKTRREHHFKPDWAPDNLRGQNYITHLAIFRRDLLEKAGGFRAGFDGSQDYDLILRATERAARIVHIPRVLYHWRIHPQSAAGDSTVKMYAYDAARRALADHLRRTGLEGTVDNGPILGSYEVRYKLQARPLISLIIENRDGMGMLEGCLDSLSRSTYAEREVIVAQHHSQDPASRRHDGALAGTPGVRVASFNDTCGVARVLNRAAAEARGDVLVFLSRGCTIRNADWLERMLEFAQRPDVGAVGAKLYHAGGSVHHAGLIVGMTGVAGYPHRHFFGDAPGYCCRLITAHNLSAVSGDCLMIRKEVWDEVGGFDPRFADAFHDLDLCLRLRQKGDLIVWTPHAELCWRSARLGRCSQALRASSQETDRQLFVERWRDFLRAGDPYYNPNLTLDWEDFSLAA